MQKKPYVLGLDMGGTNSVLGVVDARGHVLARTSIKTQAFPDINDYVNALYVEAEKIISPIAAALASLVILHGKPKRFDMICANGIDCHGKFIAPSIIPV